MLAQGSGIPFSAALLPIIFGSDLSYFKIWQPFDGQMSHCILNIQSRFLDFVRACDGIEQLRKCRAVRVPDAVTPGLGCENLPFNFN